MRHMLDHAREVVAMVHGGTRRDLDTDRMLQLALTRLIGIIGDAANRVTTVGYERYPEIPWLRIIGTRNRIIHGYDAVDHDIVWGIVTVEMPALVTTLERALPGHRG